MIRHIIFLLCICSIFNAHGQQGNKFDLSRGLTVGNKIPQLEIANVLFNEGKGIQLNSSGKVILLDFFDTFCTACIASLPKLQNLQSDLSNDLQIFMVTWQDKATIEKFWSTNAYIKDNKIRLPVIYGDTLLRKMFPHIGIPHIAWLFNQRVQAVTFTDFVSKDNILKLAKEGVIALPTKWDFDDNVLPEGVKGRHVLGEVRLTGFQDGRPTQSYVYGIDSITGLLKTSIINQSIIGAYTNVLDQIKKTTFILRPERIELLVSDSSRFNDFRSFENSQVWLSENAICYERLDRYSRSATQQAELVIRDLNTFLNLKVYWAKRTRRVLAIRGAFKKPDQTIIGNKIPSTDFLTFGLDLQNKYPVAIDLVGVKEPFVLPSFKNLYELNTGLAYYGLKAVEENREIDVLVFEEIK